MLKSYLAALTPELSAQNCLDNVQTIIRHHRIQASPGYRAAAQECLATLHRSGVEARIVEYPATGRNFAWSNLTPQEWACQDAECWLLGPGGERVERLAWYGEMELSIIQRSVSTPPEGITAELAVPTDDRPWAEQGLAGKILLVGNGDIHAFLRKARAVGALGLLTDRMTYHPPIRPEGDLADARQYTSFWWGPDEPKVPMATSCAAKLVECSEVAKGWGFVLTPAQGARLRKLIAQGPVRLWCRVETSFYDGTIENLEAIIPGETDEEVLVVSHLCHPKPSTNDNATGPATMMELARAIQKLIRTGQLAKPKRTIRFLHPPEMTGTYAHLAALSATERNRIVGAVNVDMIGQDQAKTGSVLLVEYPPLACPSFAGDLMALALGEVAAETHSHSGTGTSYALFRHAVTGFSGGSDHYILADPTVGVPCPMVIQWPDRFYHTSADTLDKVDPTMMKRVGLMTGAYALFLANAGEAEAAWLATEMAARFPAQLHEAPVETMAFRLERKVADLGALRRLASGPRLEAAIALAASQVQAAAEMEMARVALVAGPGAQAAAPQGSGARGQEVAGQSTVSGWNGSADLTLLRPRRLVPGPVSLRGWLDRLPEAEAESWRSFEGAHHPSRLLPDGLLYWTDGERSLAEICRLTELEFGLRDEVYTLGWFQLLARLGLVEL